ncbi:hypothetical protein ACJMQP_04170 [Rhodopseudomonas palustris]
MANETLFAMSGPGVAPYSARGLTQTLDPISAAASLRRTINARLVDLSRPEFRKYTSTVSCKDHVAPALDGIFPGDEVTVDCAAELSFRTGAGSASRPIVPGSLRTDGAYSYYRPRLHMKVVSYTTQTDEWGCVVSWTLVLEEV